MVIFLKANQKRVYIYIFNWCLTFGKRKSENMKDCIIGHLWIERSEDTAIVPNKSEGPNGSESVCLNPF